MADGPAIPQLLEFGLANYRSLGADGFKVKWKPKINVFIGKNNCGKSNMLLAIERLSRLGDNGRIGEKLDAADRHEGSTTGPSVFVALRTEEGLNINQHAARWQQRALELIGPNIEFRWDGDTGDILNPLPLDRLPVDILSALHHHLTKSTFSGQASAKEYIARCVPVLYGAAIRSLRAAMHSILSVPVFREIRNRDATKSGAADGSSIINDLRNMQAPEFGHDDQEKVFEEIHRFIRDLVGIPDLRLKIPKSDQILIRTKKLLALSAVIYAARAFS